MTCIFDLEKPRLSGCPWKGGTFKAFHWEWELMSVNSPNSPKPQMHTAYVSTGFPVLSWYLKYPGPSFLTSIIRYLYCVMKRHSVSASANLIWRLDLRYGQTERRTVGRQTWSLVQVKAVVMAEISFCCGYILTGRRCCTAVVWCTSGSVSRTRRCRCSSTSRVVRNTRRRAAVLLQVTHTSLPTLTVQSSDTLEHSQFN